MPGTLFLVYNPFIFLDLSQTHIKMDEMRKILIFAIFLLVFTQFCPASPPKDEKRVEEETRQVLRKTEAKSAVPTSLAAQPAPSLEFKFYQNLLTKKYAVGQDILLPLLSLIGEKYPPTDQLSQITLLKEKKVVPAEATKEFFSDAPLRKGVAAYLFCRAMGIKGGVMPRLFGLSRRYAFNQLVYMRIMPGGGVDDLISGRELISIFTNAAAYYAQNKKSLRMNHSSAARLNIKPGQNSRLGLDYGGWFNYRYSAYRNDDKDSSQEDAVKKAHWMDTRIWFKATLKPPADAPYSNEHYFYLRIKDLMLESLPKKTAGGWDHDGPHLEYAYFNIDARPFWFKVGRQYMSVGQGVAYGDVSDGAMLAYFAGKWDIKGFISHSLPHQNNVDESLPGYDKGSDRYFYGMEWVGRPARGHAVYSYAVSQKDFSGPRPQDPAHDYCYNSDYFGLGAFGNMVSEVSYDTEVIKENGKSFVYDTQEKKGVDAWAGVFKLNYKPRVYSHPAFNFTYAFGTGDSQRVSVTDTQGGNLSGRDRNFLYFGYMPTGFALFPRLSNLKMYRIGASFRPLEKNKVFSPLTLGIGYYRFYKVKPEAGIYDPVATEPYADVGQEIDLTLGWRIFSDLGFSLQYGHFIPGKAYPVSAHDSQDYFSASTTLTF